MSEEVGYGRNRRSGVPGNKRIPGQWGHREYELDHYFDNLGQIRLRDNVGQLTRDKDGGFVYQLDTSGFHPGELKVSVERGQIVVAGDHKADHQQGESVERYFTRRVAVPKGIRKETIQCRVDEQGRLLITGTQAVLKGKAKDQSGKSTKSTIPIEYEESSSSGSQQQ